MHKILQNSYPKSATYLNDSGEQYTVDLWFWPSKVIPEYFNLKKSTFQYKYIAGIISYTVIYYYFLL